MYHLWNVTLHITFLERRQSVLLDNFNLNFNAALYLLEAEQGIVKLQNFPLTNKQTTVITNHVFKMVRCTCGQWSHKSL